MIIFVFIFMFFVISVNAEDDKVTEIEQRKVLANKMFEVCGGEKRLNQVLSFMIASANQEYGKFYNKMSDELTFASEGQKQKFLDDYEKNSQLFSQEVEDLLKKVNIASMIIEIFIPIYAELYTIDELNQLISFYLSPLGQKLINDQPQRLTRANEEFMQKLGPIIQKITQDCLDKEKNRLSAQLSK